MLFETRSLKETEVLAKLFARCLAPGSLVIAKGNLGAGKTAFAKGLAQGLGVKNIVNSPTFNIIKVYEADRSLSFYHIDAYRLEDKDAVRDIGLEEILGDRSGICYVEWGEFISEFLDQVKDSVYTVEIEFLTETRRKIRIERTK